MKNIVLIGLSGCGKTTLGAALAKRLCRRFCDMDKLIEDREHMAVSEIFSTKGEPYFRGAECELAKELSGFGGMIIATGGGAVLNAQNVAAFKKNGIIIYINRPPEQIAEDIDYGSRPLIQGGRERLFKLSLERSAIYLGAADAVLDNTGGIDEALAELDRLTREAEPKRRFAVIGDPIGHTLSPQIHSAAFRVLAVNAEYEARHVPKGTLSSFNAREYDGFNITIPHKKDIIPLLDHIDPEASACGAVNTVVVKNGALCGYNTDMRGFSESLAHIGLSLEGKRVTILGAGGAAFGIACRAVIENAALIRVLARDPDKAREACQRAGGHRLAYGGMDAEPLREAAADSDLIVNATPLGMTGAGGDFTDLSFLGAMRHGAAVCDLIYNPARTTLLKEAEKLGLKTLNGLPMLINQALHADSLFYGAELNIHALYDRIAGEIEGILGGTAK